MIYVIITAKGLAKFKNTENRLTEGRQYEVRKMLSHSMIEVACDRNLICPLSYGDYEYVA